MPLALSLRLLVLALVGGVATAQRFGDTYKSEPIRYGERETRDAVTELRARLDAGDSGLEWVAKFGYLPAVLGAFDVPRSSQGLVFSKTSLQHRLISPHNPRAVYFGDEVYVGFVPGGEVLEITAMDPVQGPIFYSLEQRQVERPVIERRGDRCLTCHGSDLTQDWPGHLVRSVHSDPAGHPILSMKTFVITHDSPLETRWGGWYVTGTHGEQRHMGNVTLQPDAEALDVEAGANVEDLTGRIQTARYLTAHSDIVALMVLEHQAHMHNLLAWASYRTRRALHMQAASNRALGLPEHEMSPSTRRQIRDAANAILEYLLFKNEAPLTAKIRGTSDFATEFIRGGQRDAEGRSLRELDLETRLFRYPCSYVIYSASFDNLPEPVLDIVYTRLWRILTGRFGRRSWRLDREQRQAILDILLATKTGLPAEWEQVDVR